MKSHLGSLQKPTATGVSRGLALCIGLLLFLEPLAHLRGAVLDVHPWWSFAQADLPPAVILIGEVFAGTVLLLHGVAPRSTARRERFTTVVLLGLIALCMLDIAVYYDDLFSLRIRTEFPIPLTFFIALLLGFVYRYRRQANGNVGSRLAPGLVLGFFAGAFGFPMGQMMCQGMVDHRFIADAAVVFGARVYSHGRLSNALEDRVRTAVELYRQGTVRLLVMSGGPGDDSIDEPEAMRRRAVELGVDDTAIICDHGGLSTLATVHNAVNLFRSRGIQRVLAVSHFYHLPRIDMTFRAAGFPVATVPAPQARVLRPLPRLLLREVGGLWIQYLRAGLGDVDKVAVAAALPPVRKVQRFVLPVPSRRKP